MVPGRSLPIVLVLVLAGLLARQGHTPGVDWHPAHPSPPVRRNGRRGDVIPGPHILPVLALGPLPKELTMAANIIEAADRAERPLRNRWRPA